MNLTKLLIVLLILISASNLSAQEKAERQSQFPEFSSKPYARYWWFASKIKEDDVRFNLDWLKAHGFGGVEVAWVYPLNRFNKTIQPTLHVRNGLVRSGPESLILQSNMLTQSD